MHKHRARIIKFVLFVESSNHGFRTGEGDDSWWAERVAGMYRYNVEAVILNRPATAPTVSAPSPQQHLRHLNIRRAQHLPATAQSVARKRRH